MIKANGAWLQGVDVDKSASLENFELSQKHNYNLIIYSIRTNNSLSEKFL